MKQSEKIIYELEIERLTKQVKDLDEKNRPFRKTHQQPRKQKKHQRQILRYKRHLHKRLI